jgi:hypothetical protein
MVGGAITPVFSELEEAVEKLYGVWSQSPQMEGLKSFEAFAKEGFHYSKNPREIQNSFVETMGRLNGYRAFVAFSNRARMSDISEIQRMKVLYGALLPDIISYVRTAQVCLLFEQNTDLNSWFPSLVGKAVSRATHMSGNRTLPTVTYRVVEKQEHRLLALIDYTMAIVSNWVDSGYSRDPENFKYRQYRAIEANIAMIYDFDRGLRSTRAHRQFS